MKPSLIPFELFTGEWIISCPELFGRFGYEGFSYLTYASREACQEAIDRLHEALPELLLTAGNVIDRWEGGDLAGAVRAMAEVLRNAWSQ